MLRGTQLDLELFSTESLDEIRFCLPPVSLSKLQAIEKSDEELFSALRVYRHRPPRGLSFKETTASTDERIKRLDVISRTMDLISCNSFEIHQF